MSETDRRVLLYDLSVSEPEGRPFDDSRLNEAIHCMVTAFMLAIGFCLFIFAAGVATTRRRTCRQRPATNQGSNAVGDHPHTSRDLGLDERMRQ